MLFPASVVFPGVLRSPCPFFVACSRAQAFLPYGRTPSHPCTAVDAVSVYTWIRLCFPHTADTHPSRAASLIDGRKQKVVDVTNISPQNKRPVTVHAHPRKSSGGGGGWCGRDAMRARVFVRSLSLMVWQRKTLFFTFRTGTDNACAQFIPGRHIWLQRGRCTPPRDEIVQCENSSGGRQSRGSMLCS
jgi:hypothetical protein